MCVESTEILRPSWNIPGNNGSTGDFLEELTVPGISLEITVRLCGPANSSQDHA